MPYLPLAGYPAGGRIAALPALRGLGNPALQCEVDFAILQVYPSDLYLQTISKAKDLPSPLPDQAMMRRLVMIVVLRQIGDMDKPFDIQIFQLHKEPEGGHPNDHADKHISNVL